jgi:hypothetical protein
MKKSLAIAVVAMFLSGCSTVSTVKGWIPSFWDDNQSAKIVDVRMSVEKLDCSQDQLLQVVKIRDDLQWFQLYSQSKGWRQADVLRVIKPMQETVDDMYKRAKDQQGSKLYCELKKKVMQSQAERAASAILGRF